jgi:hypothetical protein
MTDKALGKVTPPADLLSAYDRMIWTEGYREGVRKGEDEIERLRERVESAKYEAVGWCHAYLCVALDNGIDPRSIKCAEIVEKIGEQLGEVKGDEL